MDQLDKASVHHLVAQYAVAPKRDLVGRELLQGFGVEFSAHGFGNVIGKELDKIVHALCSGFNDLLFAYFDFHEFTA